MKRQLNSFKWAFRGLWYAVKAESHMRFHITAGFYVILFSFFYSLTKAQWAVVLLLIASVIGAEAFNTCAEEICNLNKDSYDPMVKIAKDTAAGAVLAVSAAAVAVAVLFYLDIDTILYIVNFFLNKPVLLVLLLLSFAAAALFIVRGPMGFSELYHKIRIKYRH